MVWNVSEVAKANEYNNEVVNVIDDKSKQDLENFKNYYKNATEEERRALDEKFTTYLDKELQKDSELKNKLSASEIKESSEINEQDIANLNTVRNLTDVFNNYPNISSPEYRAVKKMMDEYIKDLNRVTQEVLTNPENAEWWVNNHK